MRRGNNYSGPRWPFASRAAQEPTPLATERERCASGHIILTRRGVPYCAVLPGEGPCTQPTDLQEGSDHE